MVISTGPLTGTGAPSAARFNISALSPQTGILASSNCGGSFGFHLKRAGYDALILKGKCSGHKWLEINDDQFTFHDAYNLWGMKTGQCQEALVQLVGKKEFGKLCIGPAGENLVKYAGIFSDERASGRTGLGSVLGWKNLKAITVTGTKNVPHPRQGKDHRMVQKVVCLPTEPSPHRQAVTQGWDRRPGQFHAGLRFAFYQELLCRTV